MTTTDTKTADLHINERAWALADDAARRSEELRIGVDVLAYAGEQTAQVIGRDGAAVNGTVVA